MYILRVNENFKHSKNPLQIKNVPKNPLQTVNVPKYPTQIASVPDIQLNV